MEVHYESDSFSCERESLVETSTSGVLRPNGRSIDIDCPKCRRTLGIIRGVLEVLWHHKATVAVIRSCAAQFVAVLHDQDEKTFVKSAKAMLSYPLSKLLGQPAEAPRVLSGAFRRWAKARLVFNRPNVHLWYSFQQAKRAAEPLSETFAKNALYEHKLSLNQPEEELSPGVIGSFLEGIERETTVCWKALHGADYELTVGPTGSSCLEATRADGGAADYLATFCDDSDPRNNETGPVEGAVGIDRKDRRHGLVWQTSVASEDAKHYLRVGRLLDMSQYDQLHAVSAAVLEPLKCRIVTKGPAATYYLTGVFQKIVHKALRHLSPFVLIGRPVEDYDVRNLFVETGRRIQNIEKEFDAGRDELWRFMEPEEDWVWHSVDYSAATDAISSQMGLAILDEMIEGHYGEPLPEWLYHATRSALEGHVIHDGHIKNPGLPQRRGQLMGSRVSFVILCLVNLATVRKADAVYFQDGKRQLPCLINGDDMLVLRPRHWAPVHKEIAGSVGLHTNDKSYVHADYANINSVAFFHKAKWRMGYLRGSVALPSRGTFLQTV